jgi:gliding motility-associated-like protein
MKKGFYNRTFLLFIFLAAANCCKAYHIAGGDFTYRWIGGNNFEVKLTLYRDCSNPQASDFDDSIKVSVFDRVTNLRADSAVIAISFKDSISLSGEGCSPPPDVCMQYGDYISVLNLPDNPNGYYIVWERCCRNSTVNNIAFPDRAGMAFYAEIADPALQNSSAYFNSQPLPYICLNQFFRFGFDASDIDGDSLVYSLVDPLDGGHTSQFNPNPYSYSQFGNVPIYPEPAPYTSINWASGFSLSNICGSATPLTINSTSGEIEVIPDIQGIYALAVEIREYRNGIYIGLIRREIEFTVIVCADNEPPQLPPAFTGNSNLEIYATDTIDLSINVMDANGDSIFITREGGIFANSFPQLIDPPFAVSPDTSGKDTVLTYFTWNTGCQHASILPYKVSYEAIDNGCPLSLTDIGKVNILVKEPPIVAKSNLLCIDLINDSVLSITRVSDTAFFERYFKQFVLYRSSNGSAFQPLKIITELNPVLMFDSTAYNNRYVDYCYVLSAFNKCNNEGEWSDTVCSISHINTHKNYIESVSVTNQNEITIEWEEFNDGPYAKYQLIKMGEDSVLKLYQTFSSYSDFIWVDNNVTTDKQSYCYAMINEDVCGNESDTSLIACSILLSGKADYYDNYLAWSSYINFKGGVDRYEIMRKGINTESLFTKIGEANENELVYFDRSMNRDEGVFRYYVNAIEGSGGNQAKARSNEIELYQQPVLFTPSAFTPNNDGKNDYFKTESSFITEFEIIIFNRWGQPVFQSFNLEYQWDGMQNKHRAPTGVYFYKIRYKGYNSPTFIDLTGTITLIR